MVIRSKIVKIGNSQGIRIPRTLLKQAGLTENVEMTVEGEKLIIHSSSAHRQGWKEKFAAMAANHDDQLLNAITPTEWEDEEWEW